jgi:predicted O-methyltransferase YrrM
MSELNKKIARVPFIGAIALRAYRARVALGYYRSPLSNLLTWIFKSRETSNFTYDLQDLNKRYLAALIAQVVGTASSVIMAYFEEIETDAGLKRHISEATTRSDRAFMADTDVRFARRIGWYAFARALKPRIIVETGVDKGLGSCVLTAALARNAQEGHGGEYFGLDINPSAGYLLSDPYANYGRILHGDAIESLRKIDSGIDLYISDSDHSADYEALEYKAVAGKLSPRAIILSDNAHVTDKLLEFSLATNRHFLYFQEKPSNHWYPGGSIGISYSPGAWQSINSFSDSRATEETT